jgi:hypothetical protein
MKHFIELATVLSFGGILTFWLECIFASYTSCYINCFNVLCEVHDYNNSWIECVFVINSEVLDTNNSTKTKKITHNKIGHQLAKKTKKKQIKIKDKEEKKTPKN